MADLVPRGTVLQPRGTPVDTPSLAPRGTPVADDFSTEELPTPPSPKKSSGPQGYLDDPELDRKAFQAAQDKDKQSPADWDDLMSSRILYGADRPIQGAISYMKGDGYDYGKAVDKYYDDIAEDRSGGYGKAAEVAGSLLAPGPGGKLSVAKLALTSGLGALGEGQADSVEGDHRSLKDGAVDFGVGGAFGGLIGGLGKGISWLRGDPEDIAKAGKNKTITQAVDKARTDVGAEGASKEAIGNQFRDTFKAERDAAYEVGREKLVKSTEGDLAATDNAAGRLQYFSRTEYPNVRRGIGKQPIPISPEGTPAAAKFQAAIDEVGNAAADNLSLKDLDQLRVKGQGLRATAQTAADRAAVDDLNKTLDGFIDKSIDEGKFVGDASWKDVYREGRAKIESVLSLGDNKALGQVLDDSSIPGSAIADTLMTLHGSKTQLKSGAKAIDSIIDVLGDDSESLNKIRAGVLSTLLSDGDPTKVYDNLSKFLPHNQELMGKLFTPDQMSVLAHLTASLENVTVPGSTAASEAAKGLVQKGVEGLIKQAISPAGMAGMAAGGLAHPAAGIATYAGLKILKSMAAKPVRALAGKAVGAVGNALENANVASGTARTVVRENEPGVRPRIPDEQLKREAIIKSLGGN